MDQCCFGGDLPWRAERPPYPRGPASWLHFWSLYNRQGVDRGGPILVRAPEWGDGSFGAKRGHQAESWRGKAEVLPVSFAVRSFHAVAGGTSRCDWPAYCRLFV